MTSAIPRPLKLREAHAHIAWHGRALGMLQLGDCTSAEDVLERVRTASRRLAGQGSTEWLMGVGVRVEGWKEARWPTIAQLDASTGGAGARAAWLMSFDHHGLVANSAALAAAGFCDASADPDGGVLVRDAVTGRLTGVCLEAAAAMVRMAAPEADQSERAGQVRAALADLRRLGFSEVHDLLSPPWLGPMLANMHDAGELQLGAGLFVPICDLATTAAGAHEWARSGLELFGGKVFVDGTLNSRTAWMLEDFADGMPGMKRGKALMTVEEICRSLEQCWSFGKSLAAHAIGDGAVRACLDAAERLRATGARGAFRIEHCELIDAADVPRFAELDVTASVQPCHLLSDIEALVRGVPNRLDRVLPLRELIDSGLVPGRSLVFGSDVPIVRADPGDSIQAAGRRQRAGGGAVIGAEQAISEPEAWACFAGGDAPV